MSGYQPETDTSPELKAEGVTQFQDMVGVLNWEVELVRFDILLETALISAYLALPCRGHLKKIFHVFGYLMVNLKRNICFDTQHPTIGERSFSMHDWYEFYPDANEAIPVDAPTPRWNVVYTHCFMDAEHVGNRTTKISQTGVLIFVNKAPLIWYSKRQNTV